MALDFSDDPEKEKKQRRFHKLLTDDTKTGERLHWMLDDDYLDDDKVRLLNTTPIVGVGSGSVVPKDISYVNKWLRRWQAKTVIACGVQAQDAIRALPESSKPFRVLNIPHPAARFLGPKSDLWVEAKVVLEMDGWREVTIKTDRGGAVITKQDTDGWPIHGWFGPR